MKNWLLLLSCFFLISAVRAGRITGTVTDEQGSILPYASIFVKGGSRGTTSSNSGHYFLDLPNGSYTLVCQYVGFSREEKKITVTDSVLIIDFHLMQQQGTLKEVIVKPGGEDPAYDIIRHAIKKRRSYQFPLDSFTCEVYIKTLLKTNSLPGKIMGKTFTDQDRKDLGVDSVGKGIVYLSESVTRIGFRKPDKVKLEVISGRESGSNGFGFNFPTFIDFYDNNVNVFITQLSPRGYVSPIADGALNYYRYKLLGTFSEDGRDVNRIQVTPKRRFEPLFTGTINIVDGEWRIHSLDLKLSKEYQLEIADSLEIRQIHVPVYPGIWRTQNQWVRFSFKKFGIDATGNFLNVYSKYDSAPAFPRKYFNNVVVKYDTAVNKKARSYWDSLRPVPLEPEETRDYQVKDSVFKNNRDSARSKRVLDSLRRQQGKVSVKNLLLSGIHRSDFNPDKPFSFSTQPLLLKAEYNTVEGLVLNGEASFLKENKLKNNSVEFVPHVRYGFAGQLFNAWGTVNINRKQAAFDMSTGPSPKTTWSFSGGRRVSQFNTDNPIGPLINSVYTLMFRDNYLKLYENTYGSALFKTRLESGLIIGAGILYEDRSPLSNSSNFSFFGDKTKKLFTPNYPFEKISAPFAAHQAAIAGIDLQFKPGQRYIEFPDNKMAIGSKYPTLGLSYRKGFRNVAGSDVDFDKWQFSVRDEINLKLRGIFKYRFAIGGFLNSKSVYIQDYQHFNGNQTFYASEYLNSFQLAPYYANSTIASFYATGHIEEHFNGMLTNKIPFLRSQQWNLVVAANAFYVNRNNNYVEVSGGLENIFKVLRVDVVAGYKNGKTAQVGVRLGFDGLFGGFVSNILKNPGNRPPPRQ